MLRKLINVGPLAIFAVLVGASSVFAADGGAGAGAGGIALGAGLGLGIAALGGGLGQARVAGSALEGIARNPGASGTMFVPFILGMVLIESLVIYAFIIAFQLVGKV